MTPQKQRYRHRPADGEIGDCHRTAIACLLDISRDDVPHFGEQHMDDAKAFFQMVKAFLSSRGLSFVDTVFQSSLEDLLRSQAALNPGVYYLLGGTSRTGVNHTVIACDDEIVWDPSLDDAGIVGPCDDGFYWVTHLIPATIVRQPEVAV